MNWNDSTVRPQGARAKARSSPPARFTLPLEQGTLQQQQNKKPLTQISLQNPTLTGLTPEQPVNYLDQQYQTQPNNNMSTPQIYADFNNADRHGRLRLTVRGSEEDVKVQNLKLVSGMKITVHDNELSADAEVVFSEEERIWVAAIDWSKIRRQPKA